MTTFVHTTTSRRIYITTESNENNRSLEKEYCGSILTVSITFCEEKKQYIHIYHN